MKKLTLEISGMAGDRCATLLRHLIVSLNGVHDCIVDAATHRVQIHFDPHRADLPALRRRIEAAGFTAEPMVPRPLPVRERPSHIPPHSQPDSSKCRTPVLSESR